MESPKSVCPVCTLYLRPGITLKTHLQSHSKQKVIDALLKRLQGDNELQPSTSIQQPIEQPQWAGQLPGNGFIYQQFMSSQGNLSPQYVQVPTFFNPGVMCQPYVYQQQQVIVANNGNGAVASRSGFQAILPLEFPSVEEAGCSSVSAQTDGVSINEMDEPEEKEDEKKVGGEVICIEDVAKEGVDYESNTSWSVGVRCLDELNKSCQTQSDLNLYQTSEYYPSTPTPVSSTFESNATQMYEVDASNTNESLRVVGVEPLMEVDQMQIVLQNEFLSNSILCQKEVEADKEKDKPPIVIAAMYPEENALLENQIVSMRADEKMPARGELSGQESNGDVSDVTWSRVRDVDEELTASFDLIPRRDWQVSDSSDTEEGENSAPVPSTTGFVSECYKCENCCLVFETVDERDEHVEKEHTAFDGEVWPSDTNLIEKNKIQKPKNEIKTENNFDNVFTNKLKLEGTSEVEVRSPKFEEADPISLETNLKCTDCDVVLANKRELVVHLLDVHNVVRDLRYMCGTCSELFPNEHRYTQHLKTHPLECRICAKYFYRRQNMQLHMKRHLGIKPYKCVTCNKSFVTKQKHDEHNNVHTGDAPIKCNICNKSFRRYSNLVQHRNNHHLKFKKKLKDYVCPCGQVFHSSKKLAWHREIHDAKPKACIHCSEKFVHAASLTRHMRKAHNERFVPSEHRSHENVECPICKGVFLRTSLNAHIKSHSGQRPYTCLICKKDFTTKWNLKFHKMSHAARTAKPFRCDQCKAAFTRETEYEAHMNVHKKVKPYTCNYCGAKFNRKGNQQRHVKEHEKQKNYSCQVCGKTFHRSYYLKDHIKIHSDLRPYSCHICGKTSRTKSNHNKHVKIHHARETVTTEN